MSSQATLIKNITPLDDLKLCVENFYDRIDFSINYKNDLISAQKDLNIQKKIDLNFSKWYEQSLDTLKGYYDLVRLLEFLNNNIEHHEKILNKINKQLDSCTKKEQNNFKLVLDACQKLYNKYIYFFYNPCLNYFNDYKDFDLFTNSVEEFLKKIEIQYKLDLKNSQELMSMQEEIQHFIKKVRELTAIVIKLENEILNK